MNEDSIGPVLIAKDISWSNNLRFLKVFTSYNFNKKYKKKKSNKQVHIFGDYG